jgi:hypothetical protein
VLHHHKEVLIMKNENIRLKKITQAWERYIVWDWSLEGYRHPFWRFLENRYCALNIIPIFIEFSPNVRQCMQNMVKL